MSIIILLYWKNWQNLIKYAINIQFRFKKVLTIELTYSLLLFLILLLLKKCILQMEMDLVLLRHYLFFDNFLYNVRLKVFKCDFTNCS